MNVDLKTLNCFHSKSWTWAAWVNTSNPKCKTIWVLYIVNTALYIVTYKIIGSNDLKWIWPNFLATFKQSNDSFKDCAVIGAKLLHTAPLPVRWQQLNKWNSYIMDEWHITAGWIELMFCSVRPSIKQVAECFFSVPLCHSQVRPLHREPASILSSFPNSYCSW